MIIMLLLTGVAFGAVFGMKWFGNKMMVQYVEHMPVPQAKITGGGVLGNASCKEPQLSVAPRARS